MTEKKQMKDRVFIDTNIILYAYSSDNENKRNISQNILESHGNNIYISKQVVNEITNILFKKFNLSIEKIENTILELDNEFEIFDFDIATQIKAIKLKEKYKFQFYDALIVATALENRCDILYSEDMHDGLVVHNTLKIINPFRETNQR